MSADSWGAPDGDWLTDMRIHSAAHLLFEVFPDARRFEGEDDLIRRLEALRLSRMGKH